MEPVIITAALVGAEVTLEQLPHLPVTSAQIAEAAAGAAAAGAAIVHLHVRDADGNPTQDADRFEAAVLAIRERVDVIVQVSTGGAMGMTAEERLQPVTGLEGAARPEMASLTTGSCNFGDEVFLNPMPDVEVFARAMAERGVKPEIEVFDAGMVEGAVRLVRAGLLSEPLHFNLVVGVPGAIPATPRHLMNLVDSLPANSTWTVSGIGRGQLPMSALGLVMGGHVRTGLEDNIYYRRGELAESNAQLVARVVRLAAELQRPVASVSEARTILGLRSM
ncbi:MAG: 3-keto-5-aminohexanoate cleavage enzyme [Thermoleophilia bacterium]